MARLVSFSSLSFVALSCAAAMSPAKAPVRTKPTSELAKPAAAPTDALANPPPATPAPDVTFPPILHEKLDNGLELRVVTRKNYPLIELRLVVFSGSATDGKETGVAAVTGELMKAGGAGSWNAADLAERAESLGSGLDIETGRDSTQISMTVMTGDLDAALDLLSAVARRPRFAPPEFDKLKQRELERVKNAAKSSPGWAGAMVLYRQLFDSPTGAHPYSHFDATPSEMDRITLESCKHWYQSNITPENATLVVAGDVDPAIAKSAAKRVFSSWRGARPKPLVFDAPAANPAHVVWLVDRPHSAQSQIYVAGLGPERSSPSWPAVAEANQILGGGVAGRLFLDVREKRSLAYSTSSSLEEAAHGHEPIVLSAGTQTAKTGVAVQALLDSLNLIASTAPTAAEVGSASRYLSDSFLFRTETVGAIAGLTAKLAVLDLPDGYYDDYRHALQKLDSASVFEAARASFKCESPVIVVAGDASRLAKPLSHFADVVVLDPEHEFRTSQKLPFDESQSPLAP
jgi:predicted Zn-dependent peptidase